MNAPRRRVRTLVIWLVSVLLVLGLVFAGAAWYFSGQLIDGMTIQDYSDILPDTVVAVDDDSVTLEMDEPPPDDQRNDAITGVRFAGDHYLQVGPVTAADTSTATREITEVFGDLPAAGEAAELDSRYFPEDPKVGLGIDFRDVTIDTPLGPSPAWFVPGDDDTWVIFSHGRGATRNEGLRLLSTTHELGMPTLLITFRDDLVAQYEDGISNFGMTEWPDLEAAVRYALDNGAADVVLAAASTGGAISLAFLENSDLADAAIGMLFDAPLTSFDQTVDLMADERGLPVVGWPIPDPLIAAAKWIGEQRVTIDFDETDYVSRVDDLQLPTLIMHGSEDTTNPLAASEEFVENAPEGVVRLEVFDGAEHVWNWNTDPDRYDQLAAEHLRELTSP